MADPQYRCWATRNKGYATFQGNHTYFPGAFDSQQSRDAYAQWLHNIRLAWGETPEGIGLTLDGLAGLYDQYAAEYYGDTSSRGTYKNTELALHNLLFADDRRWVDCPANDFTPRDFQSFQQILVSRNLSRNTINSRCGIIKRMFRWGFAGVR